MKSTDAFTAPAFVLLFAATLAWYRGDPETLRSATRDLEALADRTHSAWARVLLGVCEGMGALLVGPVASGISALETALRLAREHRVGLEGEADLLAYLAEALIEAGEPRSGLEIAESAVRISQERGTRWWEIRARRALAHALLTSGGDLDRAEALLAGAFALVRKTGAQVEEPFLRQRWAELARARGDTERWRLERERAREIFYAVGAEARAAAL